MRKFPALTSFDFNHVTGDFRSVPDSARACAACVHWEHFDKHERERRKQLVAECKRREEEKLDAGTSSGSSEPEKHWDNWKHFQVRQVKAQRVAKVSKHDQ